MRRIMGEVVAAFGTSHATLQEARADQAPAVQVQGIRSAWSDLRGRLAAACPDALLVISRDHLMSFSFENYPTFLIGTGSAYHGWGESILPAYDVPGHAELGRR